MATTDRIKLRHLRSLVAISEHGALVRAAEALAITQPAVSKTVAELEEIVGQKLCERSPRGVELTDAGRLLVRYAGSSLRTLREGLDSITRDRSIEAPVVLIGAAPNVAAGVLPKALNLFGQRNPQARVRVRTGTNAQLISELRRGGLDLVLGRLVDPSGMQGLNFEPLYTEVLIFAVRRGHPLAQQRPLSPRALSSFRMVLPDLGTRIREAADRFLLTEGVDDPLNAIETFDTSFGRNYVLQSDAVWCVPEGAVESDLREGVLYRLPLDTHTTEGPVGLTLRADMVPSGALQQVLAAIRDSAVART
ncbi:pca operon transcription factor PcaQ [Pigmentiphaga humi]|nr:pca operon transcription factor PcaQ [Pigmentiphaga humi]